MIFGNIGIFGVALDVSRGNPLEVTDTYKKSFKIAHKIILILFMAIYIVLRIVCQFIIFIPKLFILKLFVLGCFIYILPIITTMIITLMDDKYTGKKKIPLRDLWNETIELIRGRRNEYYGLIFSFAGWLFLETLVIGFCLVSLLTLPKIYSMIGLLIFAILYIFLIPYLVSSLVNLYRSWINEAEFKASKGLGNNSIIVIAITIIIIISLLINMLVLWLPKSKLGDQIIYYLENLDYDLKATEFKIGTGKNTITIVIPKGYKLDKDSDEYYADIDGENDYVNYSYSNYSDMETNYQNALEYDRKYKSQECTYNYEEFTLTINGKNIKAYNKESLCDYSNSYEINAYYPIDKESSLEISLLNFDHPYQQDDIKKFLNIKSKK